MQILEQDREQKIFSNFVDTIAAEKTKISYLAAMKNYLIFIKSWVPTDTDKNNHKKQEEWEHQKLSLIIDMPKEQIVDYIKSYIMHIRKRERSSSSMRGFYYAIKYFYDSNEVDLGALKWKWLKKFMGEATPINNDRAYTKEEINKLLGFCDIKLKAVVLLLASTGMRIGALSTMLKSHLIEKGDCYLIKVYNGIKGKGQYSTYCTPEARKAVEDYFQLREQYGEKLTPNSPLFRDDFNTGFKTPGSARNDVKPLSYDALRMDIYQHLIKSGLRQVDHTTINSRKEVMMSHGFRKFYKTHAEQVMKPINVEITMGHNIGLSSCYYKPTEKEVMEDYLKAIPYLTINPNQELLKQVKELKEEKNEVTVMELKHRHTMDLILEDNRKTKKALEELRQTAFTVEEFREIRMITDALGKLGPDFFKGGSFKELPDIDKEKLQNLNKLLSETSNENLHNRSL